MMSKASRKQARKAAIQREIRKREDALAVPREREVYVFRPHYCDEGGPRGLTIKDFQDHPDGFSFEQWKHRLRMAPRQWIPLEIVPENDPEIPNDRPVTDYTDFSGMMIFSQRAATALEPLLRPSGLFLPLTCETGHFVGYRLDAEVDALDVDRTRASWWPRKQRAHSIYTYAFHTERLGTAAIYRIPQHFEVLVNHEFVRMVRSQAFTGFRFCRVWPTAMTTLWWYDNWY